MTEPRRGERKVWRSAGVFLVVGLLGGAVAVDRVVGRSNRSGSGSQISSGATEAALVGAHVSSDPTRNTAWFCAFGTSSDEGTADVTLHVGNLAEDPQDVTLTVADDAGHRSMSKVQVLGRERKAVHVGDLLVGDHVAVVVEGTGAIVVEHTVKTPHGLSTAPCATVASPIWHFADGATTKDARLQLALFNPFPEEAVIDATFATERGAVRPLATQGIVVPSGQVRVVEVGDAVRRHSAVATDVRTRVGRIVAEQLMLFDGSLGMRGAALVPGTPALSDVWFLPRAVLGRGLIEHVAMHNVSNTPVDVELQPIAADGSLDPISITLTARQQLVVDLGDDERLPVGTPFAVAITANRPVLVVQHSVFATSPAKRRGVASAIASPLGATQWVLGGGGSTRSEHQVVTVYNPTDTATRVTMRSGSSASPTAWSNRPLPAGGVLQWRVGDEVDSPNPLLEISSSDAEVVVQRDLTMASTGSATGSAAGSGALADAGGSGGRIPSSAGALLSLSRVNAQVSPSTTPLGSGLPTSTLFVIRPPSTTRGTASPGTASPGTASPGTASPDTTRPALASSTAPASTSSTSAVAVVGAASTVADSNTVSGSTVATSSTLAGSTVATSSTLASSTVATSSTVPVRQLAVPPLRRPVLGMSTGIAVPVSVG
jgi:hypothetical protein